MKTLNITHNNEDVVVDKVKNQNGEDTLKFWRGTVVEYESIVTKDPNTLYIINE